MAPQRIGRAFADIILLIQIIGVGSGILWRSNIVEDDWFGFAYYAGTVAGLIAYFSFFLFSFFYLSKNPLVFWRSLFPLNLGLAIFLFTLPILSRAADIYAIALFGGVLLALLANGVVNAYPRRSLLLFLVLIYGGVMLYRFSPYEVREWLRVLKPFYLFIALGGFLLTTPLFMQYQRLTGKQPIPAPADTVAAAPPSR